jgi:NADH dehydrogenase
MPELPDKEDLNENPASRDQRIGIDTPDKSRNVLILGGGFAGLACALELAQNSEVHVTLIDKHNYQQFQPLLYQVATGLLSPSNAAFSLRQIVRDSPNISVFMGNIKEVDVVRRTATDVDGRQWSADTLVLAMGAQVSFFSTPGAEANSLPLYSLIDAEQLRAAIFHTLENMEPASAGGPHALTYVVIGGGPTGVEIAGTLADTIISVLKSDSHPASSRKPRVVIVEKGNSLLKTFSAESQLYAAEALVRRGVELRLGVEVEEVTATVVRLSNGTEIISNTVIWAAGLQASAVRLYPNVSRISDGRVRVNSDLSVVGVDHVYAIGDLAACLAAEGPPYPQLAAVAQQAGKHVARTLVGRWEGLPSSAFVYRDRGILAMIGKNDAVAELGCAHHQLNGPLAFATWLGVHASLLPVVRAKLEAILEWAWEYLTDERPAELIDRESKIAGITSGQSSSMSTSDTAADRPPIPGP